jgi:catechol 2,3-dioxygenase-like lactoylglutathione lyase family enzyme
MTSNRILRIATRAALTTTALSALAAALLTFSPPAAAQELRQIPAVIAQMQADHVEVGVDDMDVMSRWYTRVLGFKVEKSWTVDELPGVRLAYLVHPSGWRMEFASGIKGPRTPKADDFGSAFQMRGFQHLCFRVSDVDAVMAEMTRQGVTAFFPATDFPVGAERRVSFIQDPEGNVIEFAGPLVGRSRSRATR